MRLTLLLLAALPGIALAQPLPYRRIEELGPAVPDGVSSVQTLTSGGWALIRTEAANLSSPPRFGTQFYFRSPEGTLTRLPIERAGLDPRAPLVGEMAEDASFALIGGPNSPLVRIDREGSAVRVYRDNLRLRLPKAIFGNTAYLDGHPTSFSRFDLATETETIYPSLAEAGHRPPKRVTADGKAIYETNGTFIVRNLTNGLLRTWSAPAGSHPILDESGRYVWFATPGRLRRYALFTGDEIGYDVSFPSMVRPVQATDRYVFLWTTAALVAADDNATNDTYVFDRQTGAVTLASDRKGSDRAAGEVDDLAIPANGGRMLFRTPAPGVSELVSNGVSQLYARTTGRRDTRPALTAVGPGGGEAVGGVLSRGGKTALWGRLSAGQWSLRLLVEGSPPRAIPVAAAPRPLDVSDDGRTILWATADGSKLYRLHDGVQKTMALTGGFVFTGHLDPRTRTPLAIVHRAETADLTRFDGTTGAATFLALIAEDNFDADAGRVAWSTGSGVRVVDLLSGATLNIPAEAGHTAGSPGLTADGLNVGVPNLKNGQGVKTRLHRLSDGAFRRTMPFGRPLPDGLWLRDDTTDELVLAETGARFPF
ncbi:hypothetical protein EON79_05475, partial [bacterium]